MGLLSSRGVVDSGNTQAFLCPSPSPPQAQRGPRHSPAPSGGEASRAVLSGMQVSSAWSQSWCLFLLEARSSCSMCKMSRLDAPVSFVPGWAVIPARTVLLFLALGQAVLSGAVSCGVCVPQRVHVLPWHTWPAGGLCGPCPLSSPRTPLGVLVAPGGAISACSAFPTHPQPAQNGQAPASGLGSQSARECPSHSSYRGLLGWCWPCRPALCQEGAVIQLGSVRCPSRWVLRRRRDQGCRALKLAAVARGGSGRRGLEHVGWAAGFMYWAVESGLTVAARGSVYRPGHPRPVRGPVDGGGSARPLSVASRPQRHWCTAEARSPGCSWTCCL